MFLKFIYKKNFIFCNSFRSVLHSAVNEGSADGDGEANDDPIDLDDLEDSLDVVEEEEEVQEIGEVSGSEQVLKDDEDLDASLASFKL